MIQNHYKKTGKGNAEKAVEGSAAANKKNLYLIYFLRFLFLFPIVGYH